MAASVKRKKRRKDSDAAASTSSPHRAPEPAAAGSVSSLFGGGAADSSLCSTFSALFSAGSAATRLAEKRPAAVGAGAAAEKDVATSPKRGGIKRGAPESSRSLVKAELVDGDRPAGAAKNADRKNKTRTKPKKQQPRDMGEKEKTEREARTLFVGNVPLQWSKKQLRDAIRAACGDTYSGPLEPIWFREEPVVAQWAKHRGTFTDASDAKHGFALLGTPADVITVRRVVHGYEADETHIFRADGVGSSAKLQNFDRKRSVFVGNLPSNTTESDLRTVFKDVGAVDAVRIVRDRGTKKCKGIAFVLFRDRSSVKPALSHWGTELGGRSIRVTKVEQQDKLADADGNSAGTGQAAHAAEKRIKNKQK